MEGSKKTYEKSFFLFLIPKQFFVGGVVPVGYPDLGQH